jgi:hypothetical protein
MTNDLPIPNGPPLKIPSPSELRFLGPQSELSFANAVGNHDEMKEFKTSAYAKQDKLEEEGKTNHWSARQSTIMPVIDDSLVRFPIGMLFHYDEQDSTSYVNCCSGIVESICNAKTNCVCVKWSQDCLNPGEEKLLSSQQNPHSATKNDY